MSILTDVKGIKIAECGEKLEVINNNIFMLDPMYFKWGHSPEKVIKLRSGVVKRLKEATKPLGSEYKIKIWDGFRTLRVQKILYDKYWRELSASNPSWNENQLKQAVEIFVSPPSHDPLLPAPHNTGGAVDLTLVDSHGRELAMGSAFDEFNQISHTNHFFKSDDENKKLFHKNRMYLKSVMEEVGFVNYHEEWWHFSYGDQNWARQHGLGEAIYGSMEL